jgi:hypothetical protein
MWNSRKPRSNSLSLGVDPMVGGAGRVALPAGGTDTLLLLALDHIIGDDSLRDRFLALTGLDGDTLRARAGAPETLLAVRAFLAGHEPDLLAVASALGVEPGILCGRS